MNEFLIFLLTIIGAACIVGALYVIVIIATMLGGLVAGAIFG